MINNHRNGYILLDIFLLLHISRNLRDKISVKFGESEQMCVFGKFTADLHITAWVSELR